MDNRFTEILGNYEFDIHNTWDRFEEFLRMMAGRADIEYLTNKEALLDD